MASIGLGLMQGAMLADQAKKQNEELYRLKAGRELFNLQLKETEEAARLLGDMNDKARTAKKSVLKNQNKIMQGDPTGTANVLNDTVLQGSGNTAKVDPVSGEIVIVNPEGQEVGRQQALSGMQGVANIMQLGNTIEQVYANDSAAKQMLEQRAYEMTKLQTEKGLDYQREVDKARIGAGATMSAAGLAANARVLSAELAANASVTSAGLGANSRVTAAELGANAALGAAKMRYDADVFGTKSRTASEKLKLGVEADTALRKAMIDNAAALQKVHLINAGAEAVGQAPTIDPTTGQVVMPALTPEQAALAQNNMRKLYNQEAAYGALALPANTFNAGLYYGSSPSAEANNLAFMQAVQNPVQVQAPNFIGGLPSMTGFVDPLNINYGYNYAGQGLQRAQENIKQQQLNQDVLNARRQRMQDAFFAPLP